ncbi:MAG TPA: chemotaxis protein CheA [Candidatus Coprocola pullicola]|nr:chemotaxis protein CheA [Candidatus Coprocola pullicola]
MDNGMENMLDMYLFETNSLLEQLDEVLLEAEKAGTFTTDDVNEIFRIMHTIKGSSAMMEFSSLMTIAHRIEDLFYFIRENTIDSIDEEHKKELFDLMFFSTDMLRAEVEKVENNEPLSNNVDSFVEKVNSFLNKISNKSEDTPVVAAESSSKKAENNMSTELPNDGSGAFLKIIFDEGCGMENLRAFMVVTAVKDIYENLTFYPPDVETNPETSATIIEKGFLLGFDTKETLEKAVNVIKNSGNVQSYEVLMPPVAIKTSEKPNTEAEKKQQAAPKSEQASMQQAPSNTPAQHNTNTMHTGTNKQSLISVNLSKLDKLMALMGELVITESMVTSSPELQGLKLDSFTKSARQLRKLTDELQDTVMSIRMIPVAGAFQKMNRIVRDMGKSLNKDVRLTIIGEDTEVDKTIVDNIADPIMHMVRNSMDHGIEENVEDRINAGKNPQGEIILSAEHTGSEVVITIQDDGQGVDPTKVLEKAKRNGILTKPESEYSQKEVLALLMAPGFSTNEQVTEYSGRGVGMDVVKKNIEKVGGVVTISSELGKGMCTTMKIPLTMAIVDGMEVSVGKSIFTIPITNIRQSFKISSEEVIYDAQGQEIVKRMDNFYPIIRVHSLYNIDTEITNMEDGILVWVEEGEKSYCLFVDELLGEQQVVVKPLPTYLNAYNIKNSGIAGCTILGDGNISIILDIANLHHTANSYGY